MEKRIGRVTGMIEQSGKRRRRPSLPRWRGLDPAVQPARRYSLAAMMFAAPLAGSLAAVAALTTDSGPLGILVAALSFALLSVLMGDPSGGAAG